MGDKVTSIRVKEELWRDAKILAIKEGITLRELIEELLKSVVWGERLTEKFRTEIQDDVLEIFRSMRKRGEMPFKIVHEKTAVEIVREGRGE